MQKFVRGNQIVCSGTFTPVSGSAQPEQAHARLTYTDTSGEEATSLITLYKNETTGVWTGTWDSALAQECDVDWVIHGFDGLEATAQGTFKILANRSNIDE